MVPCPKHVDMEDDPSDRHPRTDAVMVVYRALAACSCVVPVDPYDPDDVGSVASEAVWSLIRAGLLPTEATPANWPTKQNDTSGCCHHSVNEHGDDGCTHGWIYDDAGDCSKEGCGCVMRCPVWVLPDHADEEDPS